MGLFETDAKCIKQREYVNIPAWQNAGYLGEGITIFHDDVDRVHSECCVDIIQTILPKAKIYSGSIRYRVYDHVVTSCEIECRETGEIMPLTDFIEKYNISQINNSTGSKASNNLDTPIAVYMRDIISKYNLFCTGSAGNDDEKNNRFKGAFVMVSGVYFFGNTDKICDYGPAWDWVDFSMFMTFQTGTSFSAPFLNGMAGLLRSRYGRDITQDDIYSYFKDHCQHLGTEGKNPEYGWGIPILGDVNEEYFKGDESVVPDFVLNSLPLDAPLRVTSAYGNRISPITGNQEFHYGIDLGKDKTKQGDCNILAAKSGTVVQNYWSSSRGWVIVIQHDDTYSTLYQHLKESSPCLVGEKVHAGQTIGIMGSTGDSTAEHLHFEIHKNGVTVDPLPYLINIKEVVIDMNENELKSFINEILTGKGTENSDWYNKEFDDTEDKKLLAAITDGTNPKGYVTREQAVAMCMRTAKLVIQMIGEKE